MLVEFENSLESIGKTISQFLFMLSKLEHLHLFSQKFFFKVLTLTIFFSRLNIVAFFHDPQYEGLEFLRFLKIYFEIWI